MLRRLLTLALMIGLTFASAALAFDPWPQWRGHNRDAHSSEKGLLDHWKNVPPLLWKAEGLGDGYAGPVVAGGIVCTMGDRDGKTYVIALDDKDGKEIWATNVSMPEPMDTVWTGSLSTPTIDGERIYAVSAGGHLVCLKSSTGELVWDKFYRKDYQGRYRLPDGYSESPLVDGDKLICTPGGPEAGMVALNKNTGKELWRCTITPDKKKKRFPGEDFGARHASPVISYGAGVKQYVQLLLEGLVGIDAETGKQLWIVFRCASNHSIRTPLVHGDYVFANSDSSGIPSMLLKLVRTDNGGVEAQEVYALKGTKLYSYMGTAVLVGDYLYMTHDGISSPQCMEFLTGKMMWERKRTPRTGSAAVIYADGHLYFHYENGATLLVAATPEKFQLKGHFKIPLDKKERWSHPAISNGRLYLRRGDFLYCYDLKKK